MPTYEYLCSDCNHEFEEFESITAPPLEKCPRCDGSVRRLISSGNGLIFKGSGFYITDYRNANEGPAKKSKESSTDKKPEKKAAKKSSDSTKES